MISVYDKNGKVHEIVESANLNDYMSFFLYNWKNLGKNEDLNNLTPGFYRAVDDATIMSLKNKPTDDITLADDTYVITLGDNDYCIQFFIGVGTQSVQMWIRGRSGNLWKPWKEL